MPVVRPPMPSREAYFDRLHQAIVQNDGIVDFAFLLEHGDKRLHYKGCGYNPDANIVTHRLVDGTYDDTLGTTDIETVHVPVYTKSKTDAQGRTRTRTFNRPRPAPYPETGANAPMHLAFAKLPHKVGGRVQYKLLGVCERVGPPTTFRPATEAEAQRLYPYHLRKHGAAVVASTLAHDQQRSRYRVTPF